MEQKKKNEGLVALLLEAFDKSAKKPSDSQESKQSKSSTVDEDIQSLTNSIKHLSDIINHHNTAINELYLLQAHVLKQLKPTSSVDSLGSSFGTTKKNNNEKPN